MDEIFPVLAGLVVGLIVCRIAPLWLRACLVGASSLLFGSIASWISGELALSWGYLLIDWGQVFVAGFATSFLASVWMDCRLHIR
jgi:hypothetical protein